MKDKIMMFIIGVLVGAVISTGAFLVYTKTTNNSNCNNNVQMPGGNPPSMSNDQTGQPPEKPSGDNMQSTDNSNSNTQENN